MFLPIHPSIHYLYLLILICGRKPKNPEKTHTCMFLYTVCMSSERNWLFPPLRSHKAVQHYVTNTKWRDEGREKNEALFLLGWKCAFHRLDTDKCEASVRPIWENLPWEPSLSYHTHTGFFCFLFFSKSFSHSTQRHCEIHEANPLSLPWPLILSHTVYLQFHFTQFTQLAAVIHLVHWESQGV